jgi:uncharacterized protein (DUF1810 family)
MTTPLADPFDLQRFVAAQQDTYTVALAELRRGSKRSHWMWFIFPQVAGLGTSEMARRYAIRSAREATAYLAHPLLGARLQECTRALLAVSGRTAEDVLGHPDHLKLQSSMTLFAAVSADESLFHRVLQRYFFGARDERTVDYLRGGCGTGG